MNLIILLLNIGILLGVGLWIYRLQDTGGRSFFWPALLVKIIAGVCVGMLYFNHYGQGDTISYWQDGREVAALIVENPVEALGFYWEEDNFPEMVASLYHQAPRSLFFVKISGVLALLTGGNYWMMSAILSFISFLGAWYLFQIVIISFPSARNAAGLAFLFYPSVVFWSSGLIKESLGLAALFILSGSCLSVVTGRRVTVATWLAVVISIRVGWNLKYYWLGIFFPVAATTLLVFVAKKLWPVLARYDVILWLVMFLVLLIGVTSIHPNFYPSRFAEVIYQSNLEFMRLTDARGGAHFYDLRPTFQSMIVNSPAALVTGLFRPFLWESTNIFSMLAGLENLMLMAIVILALPALGKIRQSPHRLLILAVITYVLLMATFLALSTPNFGTLSRYKVGVLPFLLFVSLIENRMLRRWLTRDR